jgi:hypothetical protein
VKIDIGTRDIVGENRLPGVTNSIRWLAEKGAN